MRRLRQIRGLAVVPAVIWLLIQLAMTGAVAAPPTSDPGTDNLGWKALGLQQVAICSPDGTTTLDADAPQGGGKSAPSHCEWCQSFGSLTAPPLPDMAATAVCHATQFKYRLASLRTAPNSGIQTGFLSRAPPA
ncbi:DUF2946 family protein [Hwanghaeella grinnelliae]|nr:DUF2946 family protein [Hwanghaeella grinnelliae]